VRARALLGVSAVVMDDIPLSQAGSRQEYAI
jgi:hypothetical protein